MVLEAIGYGADMRTRIDPETVCDSVVIGDFVQLRGIGPKAIQFPPANRSTPERNCLSAAITSARNPPILSAGINETVPT